jgi:predicted alpha/beta superfamily hydrolase
MSASDPEPGTWARLRRAAPLVAVALAGLAGVLSAASWLEAWREREQEARLRRSHTIEGTVDQFPGFHSALLGNTRPLAVYLPRQYPIEPERRFPVLYVQDGQDVFDGATADVAGQEWQLDEAAERLTLEEKIEPLIVVAIGSAGPQRCDEYAPSRDPVSGQGGGADRYGRMLVEELKPWIDRSYRTQPGRESTGIAGAALGGLLSLYVGLEHPAVFSRIASLSTEATWDGGFIVRFVDALPAKPDTLIWTDVGSEEEPSRIAYARQLRDALVRKGWREGSDLRYLEARGARRDAAAWALRLPDVLAFLDPPRAAGPQPPAAPFSR